MKILNKLFVYGIFLDKANRNAYGMTNPEYATVKNYATFGSIIVQAVHIPDINLCLTGLLVDMNEYKWGALDALEGGYRRIVITTTEGKKAYMYAK